LIYVNRFDIATLNARLLPPDSAWEADKERLPVAAVAIIIDPRRDGGSVLFIERTRREGDPWSGQVAFPGGRRTATDTTYLETAVREAREEVGVDLSNHELLGMLPHVTTISRRVTVAPFVFQLIRPVKVKLNAEVAEAFWISMNELQAVKPVERTVKMNDEKLRVRCFVLRGKIIWGLTYRIMQHLLNGSEPKASGLVETDP